MPPPRLLAGVVALACAACASVHPGNLAVPVGASADPSDPFRLTRLGLVVSGEELTDFSSQYFGAVELTFENRTDRWVRIQRVALDFGGKARNDLVYLPWGNDLLRWHEAASQKLAIDSYNRQVFLGTLALVGAVTEVAGAVARSPGAVRAGAAVSLGATTALAADEVVSGARAVERGPLAPEDHLFAGGFAVPPGLFTKRWVLLNTTDHQRVGFIRTMDIEYQSEAGINERVRLLFRQPYCTSEWQKDVCRRSTPPQNAF
jgi:hypothetical protein